MLPQLPREMREPIMVMAMEDTALRFWQAGKFSVTGTRQQQPKPYRPPSKVLPRNWPPEAA
jgi:hypothetical protein